MRANPSDISPTAGGPKDGDYVAYIAQIEKRQLATLAARPVYAAPTLYRHDSPSTDDSGQWSGRAPATASETVSETETERAREHFAREARARKGQVGAALLGLFGLFFTAMGLLGDGGIVVLLIGAFLLWRAWSALRRAAAHPTGAAGDLADRLTETRRQAEDR